MSGEEERRCPLCAEEMDWTDQQFKPCKCGYQVCVWCWHHIIDMAEKDKTEGRCPACRTPYDKEKIVGMEAHCERVVATKKERKIKPQKAKPKKPEVKKDLSSVRVIQRKMAYIIGLPLSLADEDLLQRKEYFGQYGKVSKVSLSRTAGGAIQQFINDTCSVYITYSKEEEAIRCIQSVHGFVLEGRFLRASFGTAKYCHAWLRNMPCTNPSCLYLHSVGAEEDSFGKDEEAAVHTRNRVHQIVGATNNMQQRSGNMLPPPIDDPFNSSSMATDQSIVRSAQRDIAHATVTSNSHLASSLSSRDKNGRVRPYSKSFVEIVGQPSSVTEIDGNVAEDRKILNLCSDFSSVSIGKTNYLDSEYSDSIRRNVSTLSHLPIGVARDKDSQEYPVKPIRESSKFSVLGRANFTHTDAYTVKGQSSLISDSGRQVLPGSCSDAIEDLLFFDDKRSKGSDSLSQGSSVLASSYPIRFSDRSNGHVQQRSTGSSDLDAECSTVYNHVDEASIPFTSADPLYIDGYDERKFQMPSKFRSSNSFANEEIAEQLRRLDDTNGDDSSALDAVESSIISNILSMDFDSCDDSSTLSHSLAELLDRTGGRRGRHGRHSSWSFRNSDESRFSFAKEEDSTNQVTDFDSSVNSIVQVSRKYPSVSDSMKNKEQYSRGSQHHVSRAQSLIPPGFSVPFKEPPPGFSASDRPNQLLTATSGTHVVKTSSFLNNQYCLPSAGNVIGTHDFDFTDPAILGVDRGKATNLLNYSGLETRTTSTPQPTTYEDEARHWLLLQQSASAHQDLKFPPVPMKDTPAYQETRFSGLRDGYSPLSDTYGFPSGVMDQHQTYYPSYSQLSQQKYGNAHISSNGCTTGLDEVEHRNEVGVPEIQRNERLGFSKYYPGYGDVMIEMPSTGNVYNRVYGL